MSFHQGNNLRGFSFAQVVQITERHASLLTQATRHRWIRRCGRLGVGIRRPKLSHQDACAKERQRYTESEFSIHNCFHNVVIWPLPRSSRTAAIWLQAIGFKWTLRRWRRIVNTSPHEPGKRRPSLPQPLSSRAGEARGASDATLGRFMGSRRGSLGEFSVRRLR